MVENISSCCCLGVGDLLRLSSSLSATEDTNNFMTFRLCGAWFARPHSCHESAGSYVSMGGGRVGAGADYRSSCGVGGGAWFARPHSCHESAGSYVSMGGGRLGAGADYRSSCGVGGGAWFARPHSCHESAGSYVSMGGDGWVLEQTTGRVVGLVVVLGLLGLIAATSLLAAMLVWESQLLN